MTDGRQTQEPDAIALNVAAEAIHQQGALVSVVGVGPKLSMDGLRLIAKYPSNIFTVQSFANLESTTQDVVQSICGGNFESCFFLSFLFPFVETLQQNLNFMTTSTYQQL